MNRTLSTPGLWLAPARQHVLSCLAWGSSHLRSGSSQHGQYLAVCAGIICALLTRDHVLQHAPACMQNIDTDQIIPAEYLTLVPSVVRRLALPQLVHTGSEGWLLDGQCVCLNNTSVSVHMLGARC
jgi:hypothetical protein